MTPSTPTTRAPNLTWRIAGFWLVVLAFGLAIVGIVVALQQARSLAYRLMTPAETRAREIADTALQRFNEQIAAALTAGHDHIRTRGLTDWEPPPQFPIWIDGLYTWDGETVTVLGASGNGAADAHARRVGQQLADRYDRFESMDATFPQVLFNADDADPLPLACDVVPTAQGPLLLAAGIDLSRLRADLIDPLLPADGHLQLVRNDQVDEPSPWGQRMFSVMRLWSVRPTQAFVDEQARTVIGQTAVHLALTMLALITLLIAMRVLLRAVRRDMALAEMKATFVANVSHELKTPLALIHMFGETLSSGRVSSEEKRQEYYRIITRESIRLTHLIDNILDFARIESGRKTYHFEPIDLATVVRETYAAYRPQLDEAGFEHHLAVADELPSVEADRDAIAQTLINLMHNAMKYSDGERYLAIDVTRDTRRGREGVLISVHDRGIGIRPEDRAHLFDGFFRASDRRVREKGGAGLGLALVKQIVESHQGSLDVESRLVKGSTFRIFLPSARQGADDGPRS